MQRSTVELACRITSGHMQNENEMPYLKEPVSFTYYTQIKKPPKEHSNHTHSQSPLSTKKTQSVQRTRQLEPCSTFSVTV